MPESRGLVTVYVPLPECLRGQRWEVERLGPSAKPATLALQAPDGGECHVPPAVDAISVSPDLRDIAVL